MARHRHAVNVRADGLTAVLGPIGDDPAVRAALLIDIDSGMVLGATGHPTSADREELGALHGELMRLACGAVPGAGAGEPVDPGALDTEVTVHRGARQHLVVRRIADPYGDRLALSLLVEGPPRALRRVRRRLGWVSTAALTAGPTVSLRPRDGAWVPGAVEERPALRAPSRTPPRAVPEPDPVDRTPALAILDDPLPPRPRSTRGPVPGLADADGLAPPLSGNTTVPSMPAVRPAAPAAPAHPPAAPPGPPPGPQQEQPERRPAPPSALPPPGPGRS
ncbi:hypothetical protein ACQEVB_28585 [Pseudonocardia sp. CA-107938]|uniref:hypothetical protein n=1 Tax=Pseudonocardia sp. CA-107938 TaxID=3240021 RepID=UPI003D940B9E